MSINPLCSLSLFHQTHSLQEINYVNDTWSHDYAKNTPCGRQSYTQTLRLLPIAKLAFEIDNSETKQGNNEKKMLQHDRKNGGNTTIQRQRSRKEPLEFDQRLYPDWQTFIWGTPETKRDDGDFGRFEKIASLKNNGKEMHQNIWRKLVKQQRQNVRAFVAQSQHKMNKDQKKSRMSHDSSCSSRGKFYFANVQLMYNDMSGFGADLHWMKRTKPNIIEEEKRTEKFARGLPQGVTID